MYYMPNLTDGTVRTLSTSGYNGVSPSGLLKE
jgi:hypothetical protein